MADDNIRVCVRVRPLNPGETDAWKLSAKSLELKAGGEKPYG